MMIPIINTHDNPVSTIVCVGIGVVLVVAKIIDGWLNVVMEDGNTVIGCEGEITGDDWIENTGDIVDVWWLDTVNEWWVFTDDVCIANWLLEKTEYNVELNDDEDMCGIIVSIDSIVWSVKPEVSCDAITILVCCVTEGRTVQFDTEDVLQYKMFCLTKSTVFSRELIAVLLVMFPKQGKIYILL